MVSYHLSGNSNKLSHIVKRCNVIHVSVIIYTNFQISWFFPIKIQKPHKLVDILSEAGN
jgi:hypothetical protein